MNNWQGSVCSVVFIGNDIQEKALKDRQTKESEIGKKEVFPFSIIIETFSAT